MNCCICGTVKNCGPYLSKVLDNMAKIGSIFEEYKIDIDIYNYLDRVEWVLVHN